MRGATVIALILFFGFSSFAFVLMSITTEDTLIRHFKFDSYESGVVIDDSMYSIDGTATDIEFRHTGVDGYYVFDNDNSQVNLGSDDDIDDLSPMSISVWLFCHSRGEGNGGRIMEKGSLSAKLFCFTSSYVDSLVFLVQADGGDLNVKTTAYAIPMNEWCHLVLTWSGGLDASEDVHIYVNNVETGYNIQTDGGGSVLTDAGFDMLVGSNVAKTRTFDGIMDNFRLFDCVISPSQIESLYRFNSLGV